MYKLLSQTFCCIPATRAVNYKAGAKPKVMEFSRFYFNFIRSELCVLLILFSLKDRNYLVSDTNLVFFKDPNLRHCLFSFLEILKLFQSVVLFC